MHILLGILVLLSLLGGSHIWVAIFVSIWSLLISAKLQLKLIGMLLMYFGSFMIALLLCDIILGVCHFTLGN